MKKPKFEKHKDIFKHFTILELEKAERVLSAVEDYTENHPNIGIIGFPISDLNCQMSEVKIAVPVLEAIKNNLFPTDKLDKDTGTGLQIYLPTQDITITKDKRLTGFYVDNFTESTLKEIRLFLSKNKSKVTSNKIPLTLSKTGLKNERNGEVYTIIGKRAEYIAILKKYGHLRAKELGQKTNQKEEAVSDAVQDINKLAMEKLDLIEKIIITSSTGYILNPLYKIKI